MGQAVDQIWHGSGCSQGMNILRVTRGNNPASNEPELLFVNLAEVKYFSPGTNCGTVMHLIHEEMPLQIEESCEDIVEQLRAKSAC